MPYCCDCPNGDNCHKEMKDIINALGLIIKELRYSYKYQAVEELELLHFKLERNHKIKMGR